MLSPSFGLLWALRATGLGAELCPSSLGAGEVDSRQIEQLGDSYEEARP